MKGSRGLHTASMNFNLISEEPRKGILKNFLYSSRSKRRHHKFSANFVEFSSRFDKFSKNFIFLWDFFEVTIRFVIIRIRGKPDSENSLKFPFGEKPPVCLFTWTTNFEILLKCMRNARCVLFLLEDFRQLIRILSGILKDDWRENSRRYLKESLKMKIRIIINMLENSQNFGKCKMVSFFRWGFQGDFLEYHPRNSYYSNTYL